MTEAIAAWSPLAAFLVSGALFAWCLLRGGRSTPSRLLAFLLGSFAAWNLFEWLWHFTGRSNEVYLKLEFVGIALAPCLAFHYALSLGGPPRGRAWALTAVYGGGAFFLGTALASLASHEASGFFMADAYNAAYLTFFTPVALWTVWILEQSRRRASDARVRSLFAYPLMAGVIMIATGFLELAMPVFGWRDAPRLASLGALAGSLVIASGVVRYRSVYDAFAVLRQDRDNVLQATVQGLLTLAPDGRVLFSNGVARELLGLDPRHLSDAGLELPAGGASVVRRGGRILELRIAPSEDVFAPGRLSLILQDKTREYEVLQALASREALASLGRGAATLAHEVRNPLTAIHAALDCIVHDEGRGRPADPRHLELVRSEIRRLDELLARTLDFSRPIKADRQPCDLNELVRRIVARAAPAHGSRVRLALAADAPRIHADPDLLVHLVENLLKNAVEASPEVSVSTEATQAGLRLRVASAGARIPDEILPRLFEPFVTTKARGTGLGLALAKKVAAAHDAVIAGRNTASGVDFEVDFPR